MSTAFAKRGLRLLIVDDDSKLRNELAQYFARRGHKVEQCENGLQALTLVDEKRFDVMVLDLAMPGICGLEVLEILKLRNVDIEVVLLTGLATKEVAAEARKLGAAAVLIKPISLQSLHQHVRKACETHRLRKMHDQEASTTSFAADFRLAITYQERRAYGGKLNGRRTYRSRAA